MEHCMRKYFDEVRQISRPFNWLVLLVFYGLFPVHSYADWPDWRGPTQQGRTEAKLPLKWSESENIVWKTAIHDLGYSTPVVLDGQIWLTTGKEDGTVLYAVCVDVDSGEVVHDIPVFNIEKPQRINPNNCYATPSAVVEAGHAYVHFGSLGTACIDTATGQVVWRRTDLACEHMQGPASSPVLYEDLLILTLEGVDKQYTAALDKRTGQTVWTYHRPQELYAGVKGVYAKSYQTPVLHTVEGKTQLVSNGALLVTGHDPRTGEEIWRVRYRDDSTISRIVTGDGLLFVNTGGSPNATELWAIREGGTGDVTGSHVVWKMTENAPHESSPVLAGDWIYTICEKGVLVCMEAKTGKQVWQRQMEGDFWASLLATPERIYLPAKQGKTVIIAVAPEYRELAVNQLDGNIWASPAVAGNSLLLRTKTHLYRIADTAQ